MTLVLFFYCSQFTDLLLVCQSLPIKLGIKKQYVVKDSLDIAGMRVKEGNNPDVPNTFCISSTQKSVELQAK